MMPVLLVFLIPLAVLLIAAAVYDLRRRRRRGAEIGPDINAAVHRGGRQNLVGEQSYERNKYLPGGGGGGI